MPQFSRGLLAASLFAAGSGAATAASFSIFEAGTATFLGVFEAPSDGGALTSISVSIGGVTYDVLAPGGSAPVYDAADNDLTGAGGAPGWAGNSIAAGLCGAGECAFSVSPIFDFATPIPGEWHADRVFVPPADQISLDLGHYEITMSAVPLPAAGLLLMTSLAGLGFFGRHHSRG
jgi:hypothetical protein